MMKFSFLKLSLLTFVSTYLMLPFIANSSFAQDYPKVKYRSGPINLLTPATGTIPCERNVSNEVTVLTNFFSDFNQITELSSCAGIKELFLNDYSEKYCQLNIECSKSKIKKARGFNTSLSKIVSNEFLTHKFKKEIGSMEKMDELRVFAEKKYGKNLAPKCLSPFNYNENQKINNELCTSYMVDETFKKIQESCAPNDSNTFCYKTSNEADRNYEQFLANYKPNKDNKDYLNESLVGEFFKARNNAIATDYLASDSEVLEALASVISSNESSELKIQNIHSRINDFIKSGKLDPILSYNDNSQMFKFFEHLILSKTVDSAAAKKAIEEYRMDQARKILENSCPQTTQLKDICKSATDLSRDDNISGVERFDATAISRSTELDVDLYNSFQKRFPTIIKNKNDFKVVLAAERCKAFSYVKMQRGDSNYRVANSNPFENTELRDAVHNAVFYSDPDLGTYKPLITTVNNPSGYSAVKKSEVVQDVAPVSTVAVAPTIPDKTESKITSNGTPSNTASSISTPVAQTTSPTIAQAVAQTSIPQIENTNQVEAPKSFDANNTFTERNTIKDQSSSNSPKNNLVTNKKQDKNDSGMNSKIAELTDELEASKADVQKLKDEQLKNQQTSQQSELSDLRGQIESMKAENKKVPAVTSAQNQLAEQSVNQTTQVIPNAPTEIAPQVINTIAANKAMSENLDQKASRSQAKSNGATPIVESNEQSSAEAKQSLTLTQLDGMSKESAMDKINDKILELKVPFLVVENGEVIEIIPKIINSEIVYENGKPVYEKRKVDKNKASLKAKKALANAIVSPADLQRYQEQQLKIDRTKLQDLNFLTKGLLKSHSTDNATP